MLRLFGDKSEMFMKSGALKKLQKINFLRAPENFGRKRTARKVFMPPKYGPSRRAILPTAGYCWLWAGAGAAGRGG